MRPCHFLVGFALFASCASAVDIVDQPIIFNEEREEMTLEYLADRYGMDQESPAIVPRMIVLHWTAIPTFEESFETFDPAGLGGERTDIKSAGNLNVSAHFLVARDGTIYRLMPETTMARHVIGLNHCSIGIENVGGTADTPLTGAQVRSDVQLVKYLKSKYPIEYLIGHYEYTDFTGNALWLEKDTAYRTLKTDPGKDFMRKVRNRTRYLNFKPVPEKPTDDEN